MAASRGTRNHRSASGASTAPAPGEINALRSEAYVVLDQKNSEKYANEYLDIDAASTGTYGSPRHALCNLIVHLMNHGARSVLDTYVRAMDAGLPEEVLLTDDHITVRIALSSHRTQIIKGKATALARADFAEYESILFYALNNIEDGHLIVTMYVDRGMRTLQEILDLLPALKNSGHQTLTKGLL